GSPARYPGWPASNPSGFCSRRIAAFTSGGFAGGANRARATGAGDVRRGAVEQGNLRAPCHLDAHSKVPHQFYSGKARSRIADGSGKYWYTEWSADDLKSLIV